MTPRTWIATLEAVASIGALALVAAMFLNSLDAYLVFFGEVAHPTPAQAQKYRAFLVLAVVAVAVTMVACASRRGRGAFVWHVVVALVVAASGVLFAVPAYDLR